jgi:hypothetical protein
MICSSVNRFFTSNLLVRWDWTPNHCATQNRGDVGLRALLELIASDLHEDVHRYLEESSIDLLDKGSGCRLLEELTEAGIGEDLTDDQEAHVAVLLHESA